MAYSDIELFVYSPTRSGFEAMVSSGEVTTSQIGIIAETGEFWENGNYHPLVLLTDYLKKDDAVNFAKDLTGTIEATPEEFTFRPSAGDKSIRDESALIRRIKGNTSVWGQLAEYNSTFTLDGDVIIAPTVSATTWVTLVSKPISAISGHKYLFLLDALNRSYSARDNYAVIAGVNTVYIGSPFIKTATATETWSYSMRFTNSSNGLRLQTQVFDLTQIFGAGNEPTTIEEFRKYYPESYYPYCEPEVRPMCATGIETIGFNALDKDNVIGGRLNADGTTTSNDVYSIATIEVLPYEKYYLKDVANGAQVIYTYALYDSDGRHIYNGAITNSATMEYNLSGYVTMPANARMMKVCVHNTYLDSCCVNISHTGVHDGEYASYVKNTRRIPDILKYFPDGMHGIGDVYDEINDENAIKRFGVVDLGAIDDYWYDGSAFRTFALSSLMSRVPTVTTYNENMVSRVYDAKRGSSSPYRIEFTTDNGALWINTPDYTDVPAFKTAMSGVMLYYELAEPETTPLTEPIQLDYEVADYGTEKMVSSLPSSPFRADIVYQFNASDRIRDNERNIERLENKVSTIETYNGGIKTARAYLTDGIIEDNEMIYALPSAPESALAECDEVLATERFIRTNMPTVAAPAMPSVQLTSTGGIDMAANTMYYTLGTFNTIGITQFVAGVYESGEYDDVWALRFGAGVDTVFTCLSTVYWENGVAPTFTDTWALYELTFRKAYSTNAYIGTWKKFITE